MLRHLPQNNSEASFVLVPTEWNPAVPVFAQNTFAALNYALTRVGLSNADVDTFYESKLYTDETVALIAGSNSSFAVLPTTSFLNEQIRALPDIFALRYANDAFALYQVLQPPQVSNVTRGFSKLNRQV
jgi:hypothetical protein